MKPQMRLMFILCVSSLFFMTSLALALPTLAQEFALGDGPRYIMDEPLVLTPLWVDPVNGDDSSTGSTSEEALRTISEAWNRIPVETVLSSGYAIHLLPGSYAVETLPNYWEKRYGTAEAPIVMEAAEGRGTVTLPSINMFDTRYFYLLDVEMVMEGDVFHCERCDHILIRGVTMTGTDPEVYNTQEALKFNQSQHIYVEDSDISGAWDNALDFVAVQYGHIVNNRIHNAGDWCMYFKGGSGYVHVEGNEFFDCGTGGFSTGQGTGFQYMVEPWIQYEAYDVRFVNNIVHDTEGAGIGVQGGYNILMANNTLYHVGTRSHLIEVVFGLRSCDGQPGDEGRERCEQYLAAGGWGHTDVSDGSNGVRIPNRNVYILNNVVYNPPGVSSAYQHFAIFGPYSGPEQEGANVPVPTLTDDNLVIAGNVIWNGSPEMPLGIEGEDQGCQPGNPTCTAELLRQQNSINISEPVLADPANGDYRVIGYSTAVSAPAVLPAWPAPLHDSSYGPLDFVPQAGHTENP